MQEVYKQDKVNTADSAFIFLIILLFHSVKINGPVGQGEATKAQLSI